MHPRNCERAPRMDLLLIRNQQAAGSNPIAGLCKINRLAELRLAFLFFRSGFHRNRFHPRLPSAKPYSGTWRPEPIRLQFPSSLRHTCRRPRSPISAFRRPLRITRGSLHSSALRLRQVWTGLPDPPYFHSRTSAVPRHPNSLSQIAKLAPHSPPVRGGKSRHPGTNRIEMLMAARFKQVVVLVHNNRLVPALDWMAGQLSLVITMTVRKHHASGVYRKTARRKDFRGITGWRPLRFTRGIFEPAQKRKPETGENPVSGLLVARVFLPLHCQARTETHAL